MPKLSAVEAVEPQWQAPPGRPELAAAQVHMWRADLDLPPTQVQRLWHLLAPDEHARAERIVVEPARLRFVAGRAVLRRVLALYTGTAAQKIALTSSPHGKPYLTAEQNAGGLQFNLTHSRGLAVLAVTAGRPVGVDVEWLRPLPGAEAIAARYFSADERKALAALPAEQRRAGFFACWTRKEACLKAADPGAWVGPEPCAAGEAAEGWTCRFFIPCPGAVGALATAGRIGQVAWWQFRQRTLSSAT